MLQRRSDLRILVANADRQANGPRHTHGQGLGRPTQAARKGHYYDALVVNARARNRGGHRVDGRPIARPLSKQARQLATPAAAST